MLKKWEDLPQNMKNQYVKKYYDILIIKKTSLFFKRVFDLVAAIILLIILFPLFIAISIAIKIDSKGPILFRQVRVTRYGKHFKIFKFRTMISRDDAFDKQITVKNDERITKVGRVLRKLRLDEIPQLLNIITGDMTFVGPRPEVPKYVDQYSPKMLATLLLPAGVTSEASICFKDEEELLEKTNDAEEFYVREILPQKMEYNLKSLEQFSLLYEAKIILFTICAIIGKNLPFINDDILYDRENEVKF